MAKVRLLQGKPLMVGGKVALSDNCCCQTGACCHAHGICTVATSSACLSAGGIFQGVGTVCTPNPCCPNTVSIEVTLSGVSVSCGCVGGSGHSVRVTGSIGGTYTLPNTGGCGFEYTVVGAFHAIDYFNDETCTTQTNEADVDAIISASYNTSTGQWVVLVRATSNHGLLLSAFRGTSFTTTVSNTETCGFHGFAGFGIASGGSALIVT